MNNSVKVINDALQLYGARLDSVDGHIISPAGKYLSVFVTVRTGKRAAFIFEGNGQKLATTKPDAEGVSFFVEKFYGWKRINPLPRGQVHIKQHGKKYIVMGEGYPDIRKGGHFFLNRAGVPVSVNGTPGLFDTRREAEAVADDIRVRASNPIDNKKLANLLYDNDTYALEKYLRSLPVKELKQLKTKKIRVVSTIAAMILNEGAVKKPRKSNPLYKPQPSEWNNNWGYTVWVDKNGMTASKQVMGYPNMVRAAQGAYIALQSPEAVRSGNNDRAVLFDRTGINDPKGIISPPNFSKSFTFQELREIVETQSPEFIFKGRKVNPVPEGTRSKIRKATKLYEDFRDQPGTDIIEMEQPDFSTGMVIGRLSAVEYDTVRAGKRENYRHKFKKSASPLLCVTSDGKTLFTVEGGFTFTERGIVDNG